MKLGWAEQALNDREAIWLHIALDNPTAASRLDTLFSESAQSLVDFPNLGRPGQMPNTREIVPHESYRLVYRVEADQVVILAVIHAARQWPPPPEGTRS
ncbi:MAG: type II toxin-antitoxin system RelE/ParE family toxin [Brevundimonas sp.]|nr:MAG: type II toxin-antitoxin system RelE/ParE family toxin [Brevundimonas sp.]